MSSMLFISRERRKLLIKRKLNIDQKVFSSLCCEQQQQQQQKKKKKKKKKTSKYRGYCEACFGKKKWCGFDHENKEYLTGKQLARMKRMEDENVLQLKKTFLNRIDPTEKVNLFKILSRLENHFSTRPFNAVTDPRVVLRDTSMLSKQSLRSVLIKFGITFISEKQIKFIFDNFGNNSSTTKLEKQQLLKLLLASRCFKRGLNLKQMIKIKK